MLGWSMRPHHGFLHHIVSHWRAGGGVHVRDHSLGEVIHHKSREESSEERQLLGEGLKEPYEVNAFLQQPFYLHNLKALTGRCVFELSPFRRNHLHVSIEAPPHPAGQCPNQVNW